MDEIEPDSQSFIIKVWFESGAEKAGQDTWRGYITHVTSGKHRYLKNLEGIENFILPYLEEMGVEFGMCWRIRRRLRRLMG